MRPAKPKTKSRKCTTCKGPLPAIRRSDMIYCSQTCKLIGWAQRKIDDRRQRPDRREAERPDGTERRKAS